MTNLVPPLVALFGGVAGMLATGSVRLWPAIELRIPELNEVFLSPVIAFALLAVAFSFPPARLHMATLRWAAGALTITLCYFLLPNLAASQSTDGQSGIFEALLSMSTLPLIIAAFFVAGLVQVFVKKSHRDEA
jgi:hypothetical protein